MRTSKQKQTAWDIWDSLHYNSDLNGRRVFDLDKLEEMTELELELLAYLLDKCMTFDHYPTDRQPKNKEIGDRKNANRNKDTNLSNNRQTTRQEQNYD